MLIIFWFILITLLFLYFSLEIAERKIVRCIVRDFIFLFVVFFSLKLVAKKLESYHKLIVIPYQEVVDRRQKWENQIPVLLEKDYRPS